MFRFRNYLAGIKPKTHHNTVTALCLRTLLEPLRGSSSSVVIVIGGQGGDLFEVPVRTAAVLESLSRGGQAINTS